VLAIVYSLKLARVHDLVPHVHDPTRLSVGCGVQHADLHEDLPKVLSEVDVFSRITRRRRILGMTRR